MRRSGSPWCWCRLWWLLGLLVLAEAVHELLGLGSADGVFDLGSRPFLQVAAAALCLARAASEPHGRWAWLWIGIGLACWAVGTVFWDVLYSNDPSPPYPTAADALWLAWYPLTAVGMALLIKERVRRFELHRWMDGLAVMLVVMTPAVALIVQPAAARSDHSGLATVVDFSYPILDVLLVGGILGVCGLLAWRPGRTWALLGLGCVLIALADGFFSVQEARGALVEGNYSFLWSAGALLIAGAAWASTPAESRWRSTVGGDLAPVAADSAPPGSRSTRSSTRSAAASGSSP